jgi:hypothetical protein
MYSIRYGEAWAETVGELRSMGIEPVLFQGIDPQAEIDDCDIVSCVDVPATARLAGLYLSGVPHSGLELSEEPRTWSRAQLLERLFGVMPSVVGLGKLKWIWTPRLRSRFYTGKVLGQAQRLKTFAQWRAGGMQMPRRPVWWQYPSIFMNRRSKPQPFLMRGRSRLLAYRPDDLLGLPPWRKAKRIPGFPYARIPDTYHGGENLRRMLGMFPDSRVEEKARLKTIRREAKRLPLQEGRGRPVSVRPPACVRIRSAGRLRWLLSRDRGS